MVIAALEHIFRSSPTARDVVTGMAFAGTNPTRVNWYRSQQSMGSTRPDLAGIDGAGEEVVLLEAKFWAGLTDQQPWGYVERLRSSRKTALCFIVPETRRPSLWPEVLGRLEVDIPKDSKSHLTSFKFEIDANCVLTMITWTDLLQSIVEATSAAGERKVLHDVEQLIGLSERIQSEGFIPFTSEDLGPSIPRLLDQLTTVAVEAINSGVSAGRYSLEGYRAASTWDRYTRYFESQGLEFSLSVHYTWWRDFGISPIWLHFQGDKSSTAFKSFMDVT